MDDSTKDKVRKICSDIAILITIATGIYAIIKYLKQYTGILTIAIPIFVISSLLILGIYIFVKKSKRRGIYFIAGGFFILAILVSVKLYPALSDRNKIIILLADFEEPDSGNYHITEIIKRQLDENISEFDSIRVKCLNEVITEKQGDDIAIEKGKKHKASIVIWGSCYKTKEKAMVIAHFNTLRKMPSYNIKKDDQVLTVSLGELENFHIQYQLSGEMTYLTLFTIGLASFLSQDYNASIIQFSNAINNRPSEQMVDIDSTYLFRGNAYLLLDNSCLAISDYYKAIKLNPKNVYAYVNRGIAYRNKGNIELAIKDYDTAIGLESKFVDAYINRADIYISRGELRLAIKDYDTAIGLEPKNVYAYVNRGTVYGSKGEIELAIGDFDKAIELNPKDALAYYNRGFSYHIKGEKELAERDLKIAIKLDPKLKSLLSK